MYGVVTELYGSMQERNEKIVKWNQDEQFLSKLLFSDEMKLFVEPTERIQSLVNQFERSCERNNVNVNVE